MLASDHDHLPDPIMFADAVRIVGVKPAEARDAGLDIDDESSEIKARADAVRIAFAAVARLSELADHDDMSELLMIIADAMTTLAGAGDALATEIGRQKQRSAEAERVLRAIGGVGGPRPWDGLAEFSRLKFPFP